jgi:hypothetical protein
MQLLIDDMRNFDVDAIARTPDAARTMLKDIAWETVYFDHDLGPDVESGYDILTWALENDLLQGARVMLVTSNPSGRLRMEAALENHGYRRSGQYFVSD